MPPPCIHRPPVDNLGSARREDTVVEIDTDTDMVRDHLHTVANPRAPARRGKIKDSVLFRQGADHDFRTIQQRAVAVARRAAELLALPRRTVVWRMSRLNLRRPRES